jgi:hypothetical protein
MDRRLTRRAATASACAGALAIASAHHGIAQDVASPAASPSPEGLIPDTPAGNQLAWVLAVINGDEPVPDEPSIEARFAPATLALLPVDQMIATFEQLKAQLAPVRMLQIVGIPTPLGIDAVIESSGGVQLVASVTVERDPPHRIEGLLFSPYEQATPEFPPLGRWSDLDTALAAAGANQAIFAGSLDDNGAFNAVHELNPEAALPIGSAFKLYVLGALATAIEDGRLSWSDDVEVTDSIVSLPSGVTQNEITGSMLPIDELARRMISVSDNTATDMLIATVGRDACEAALEPIGNSVPERNMPFLTTRVARFI